MPDRLFFSLNSTIRSIMEEASDMREFIPELYYLPELFINLNEFNFGVGQSGRQVHNVELFSFAKGSPFFCVFFLRSLLEGPECSGSLHKWLDLIFGPKAHLPEAEH